LNFVGDIYMVIGVFHGYNGDFHSLIGDSHRFSGASMLLSLIAGNLQ